MRKHHLLAFSVAAGLTLSGLAVQPALAVAAPAVVTASKGRPAPVKPVTFRTDGVVASVDADAAILKVAVPAAGGTTSQATLTVAATASVTVDGVAATLAEVPVGSRIKVTGSGISGTRTATRLAVTTTWNFRQDGVVASVDADAATVAVTAANGAESVIPVAEDATVVIDGVVATLAEVPAGARVKVTGIVTNSVGSATALAVTTTWGFRQDGVVASVDADAATVAVTHLVRGRLAQTTIPVADGAVITLNRSASTLAALPVGAQVQVSGIVTNGVESAKKITATKTVKRRR
ncbi:hypothetical protein Ppa06_61200 [Planomonospora parontospora subsp. parontospora]|uniref:DUF5666 domain-containing protein n=2 Tax=Planomonospora parontospora TaxID=58119 RepID=A0AA37BF63_9ACTN|nr:hypothetical protein [Planomonospora parontospora]GGK62193.1 hypothetical protein GCM10010126_22000 [Planomonospora parontospora]GII12322.1 hypothetical protein Ppa06_61200 [Planomonospora parontospora subsp. parontospora]